MNSFCRYLLLVVLGLSTGMVNAQTLTIETVTPNVLAGTTTTTVTLTLSGMPANVGGGVNIMFDEPNIPLAAGPPDTNYIVCAPGFTTCRDLAAADGLVNIGYFSALSDGLLATITFNTSASPVGTYTLTAPTAIYNDGAVDQPLAVVDGGFTIDPLVDLSITKSDMTDPVVASNNIIYTLIIDNAGPSDASSVVVTDVLPSGVTYNSATGTGWSCSHLTGTVTCNRATFTTSDGPSTITIDVTAPANGATLSNTASISNAIQDSNLTNNSDTEGTTVNSSADLSILKSDSADPVVAGTSFDYQLTIDNAGPSDASMVVVTDVLPAGVVYNNATGTGWACSELAGTVSCSRNSFAAGGGPSVITINVTAPNNGANLSNVASISSATPDPNMANDSATEPTQVTSSADLSLAKSDLVDPVVAAGNVVYVLTVLNAGPSDASMVSVSDTLPAGVSYNSATGTGWSCNHMSGTVTCSRATLAAGDNFPITIDVTAPANGTNLLNSASVTTSTPDPDALNNNDTEATGITSSADLAISKDDGVTEVIPNASITYTIIASNAGPSDVVGASVTDTFPAEVQGVTWMCSGTGASCPNANGPGNISETVDLPAGSSLTYVASGTVAISATGTLSNTATIGSAVADPSAANNSDTHLTTVNLPPQVASTYSVARPNGSTTAITQIYVIFDEDVVAADMTAAFQLLNGGNNGVVDTPQCGPVLMDDVAISIDSVSYDGPSRTSRVAINGGAPLGRNHYVLMVCASIMDPQGNPLDGNGNRLGGDEYFETVQISIEHQLANPNFDNNVSGWTIDDPIGGTVFFDPTDSDAAPTSGSLSITDVSGSGSLWTLSQCGDANQFDAQVIAVRARTTSPIGSAPTVATTVEFYASPDCSGLPLSTLSGSSATGDSVGQWELINDSVMHPDESQSVQSAKAIITVDGGSASSFEVLLDDGVFYVDGLFDNGFED